MAFVPEAALIALREGLEAFLIVGILLGLVTKLDRPDARKWVWGGFAAAVLASVALGVIVQKFLLEPFEERGGGEWFELVAALAAVVVLTYMVFWMWKHTRSMVAGLRKKVAVALTQNTLFVIAFLAFASVLREGLEVVLFYGALGARNTAMDLAWSGLVGALVSVAIVLVILRTTIRFDLARFFAVTGILLVFVAAGLLVHSVHAAQEIGIIPATELALWDTSGLIPNDRADGRVLHALFGYEATPNLLQALLYFGYLFGVGIPYLWHMGLFHRRAATGDRRVRPAPAIVVALLILLATAATAYGAGNGVPAHGHHDDAHDDGAAAHGAHYNGDMALLPERIGVLLRVHGEPVHYNESTYPSFRAFYEGILINAGMEETLAADQGTMLLDRDDPFCTRTTTPAPSVPPAVPTLPALHDAWTRPFALPAAIVPDPTGDFEGCLYGTPGGPGLGEPDILEIMGLATWRQWMKMDETSPMYETQYAYRMAAQAALEAALGDRVVVGFAHHIQPKMEAQESEAAALRTLIDAGVDVIVDAYGSAIHSDVMDGCMMWPHVQHALAETGFKGKVLKAGMPGAQPAFAEAVAAKVEAEVARVPAGTPVSLFLTHHGLGPDAVSPCNGGADPYHAGADVLYENVRARLNASGLDARFVTIEQVYGQSAEGEADPDDEVTSSSEAFERARAAGARHIIDIPYELTGDGFDNLVAHREGWGWTHDQAPYYDDARTSTFTRSGVTVHITSSAFGAELRGNAWAQAVLDALAGAYGGDGAAAPGHDH